MRIVVCIAVFLVVGCQCPEKAVLRESMDQGMRTIRSTQKDWAAKLVAYPVGSTDPRTGQPSTGRNQCEQISPLTPAQYDQVLKAHKEYEDLVNEDRARDGAKP